MLARKWTISIVLLVAMIGLSSWGFLVHRTVNQIAIYNLPEPLRTYFHQDKGYLVSNAPRPDTRRNSDKTEATKHFIDIEKFGPNAANNMPLDWASAVKKYSEDTLKEYGWGPYNVIMQLDHLTNAFKTGNQDSILFYAADVGHYIGDLHVPLHTTINYDGQLTGQKGLHAMWESTIPELAMNQFQLFNNHKATYLKDPAMSIWQAVRKANSLLPAMLAIEKEVSIQFTPDTKYQVKMWYGKETKAYTKEFAAAYAQGLGPTINAQLISSANLITDFWYTAWVNAGKPNLATTRALNSGLEAELKSYQQNKLITDGLLLSKKEKPEN
jgi:hypothetical protein